MSGVEEAPRDQPKLITNLYFIARNPKYATVKPYTVRFDPKGKFPYTNIDNVKHSVELCNLRSSLNKFRIKENGFQIMTIPERMTYADFENDETFRAVHVPHILTALQAELKAKHVHVLDYRVRKRDENFPVRSEQQYEFLQPSSRVHIDYTAEAVKKTVRGYYGNEAGDILDRPWQAINVWHPIRGPCVDWPLAVCDAATVDFDKDTMASDFVDLWGYSENVQVHHSEAQRWYYLENQMPNELLVFKSADSEEGKPGVLPAAPHGSFDNPNKTAADLPRQSVELRLLVTY
ncbi:hypothetical protein EG328_003860 [Venturia inaequalis]|uniref:CmcJ-like methyltransferase n=1 Tax=Venturia inaequalis TaxID=5025 RepID=A0A8H3VHF7_VENIN|nr:hypothetical protein EG328_003860 [Venturia inaequalis]